MRYVLVDTDCAVCNKEMENYKVISPCVLMLRLFTENIEICSRKNHDSSISPKFIDIFSKYCPNS